MVAEVSSMEALDCRHFLIPLKGRQMEVAAVAYWGSGWAYVSGSWL